MRRLATLLALTLSAALTGVPVDAHTPTSAPVPYAPVGFGESVAYDLPGAPQDVVVRVVLTDGEGGVEGPASMGPTGSVVVPDPGPSAHGVTSITVQAWDGSELVAAVPLRPKRLEVEHGPVVAGQATRISADDPFGGGEALEVNGPTVIDLGPIDLSEISSVAIRAGGPELACHPSYEGGYGTYCLAGVATLTSGAPDGPVLAVMDIRGTDGYIRTLSEPLRHHPDATVELFLTVVPVTTARINYLELNGSGAAEPHRFAPDPEGTVTLFDGSSMDGWEMAGTGSFELEDDGSMRSVNGYGLLWYAAEAFEDFTLRLGFKVSSPDANSGVFVRFADPGTSATEPSSTGYEIQVQDYGQAYFGSADTSQTGAIYATKAADRINTRTVGDWNTMELTVMGHEYTVSLNGRVVNRFTGDRRLSGHIGFQNHDPSGTIWYRDVRVIPA